MRTTTIQIARILHDALPPGDLARLAEALEGYLIDNDPDAGAPNPTLARRTDVAGDLLDRIETGLRDDEAAALADGPAPVVDAAAAPADPLADALRRVDECLDRAEGAAERLRGEDGRCVRDALDDASEIVARALKGKSDAMNDYDRFLKSARDQVTHIGRIAANLLSEGRIGQGTHDALVCAAGHVLKDAYMAGLCEADGVTDVGAELRRIGHA